ncbi:MAG: hypothetical protein Q4A67_05230 [Aerococcus sp.]|nr:hypothetical protein [Aerococcus sp.]
MTNKKNKKAGLWVKQQREIAEKLAKKRAEQRILVEKARLQAQKEATVENKTKTKRSKAHKSASWFDQLMAKLEQYADEEDTSTSSATMNTYAEDRSGEGIGSPEEGSASMEGESLSQEGASITADGISLEGMGSVEGTGLDGLTSTATRSVNNHKQGKANDKIAANFTAQQQDFTAYLDREIEKTFADLTVHPPLEVERLDKMAKRKTLTHEQLRTGIKLATLLERKY